MWAASTSKATLVGILPTLGAIPACVFASFVQQQAHIYLGYACGTCLIPASRRYHPGYAKRRPQP
ncbi:hypothetical protein BV22DRAFT_1040180 [Leucogyrophana mollusca]|uniref:Uncharacterized protein n=1 Tax=Leucogyrophana mollusca TaxID=85980 RepID=A0ACB8B3M0_9AGAM|nr:hypothetical protein BV22DRAFT_1040180 [Leucogyrophana mollusca]